MGDNERSYWLFAAALMLAGLVLFLTSIWNCKCGAECCGSRGGKQARCVCVQPE